ncbi:MAG: ABC transporter permease [Patescibacteria group bacterium]|nr:ABC transporter permease [Patescibacteria group bacterium]
MGFWNLLKFSTRMFKARTSRTLLTILGMGVGIAAILFLVALGFGVQRTLLETITTADSLLTVDAYPGGSASAISQTDVAAINKISGVDVISPVFATAGQMKFGGLVAEVKIMAVDEKFLDLEGLPVQAGKKISGDAGGAVISGALLKVFEKTSAEMLGENFKVSLTAGGNVAAPSELDYKVSGVVDKKDMIVYVNKKSLDSFFPVSEYSKLKVKSSSSRQMAGVRNSLTNSGFIVSALTDVIDQVEKTFRIIRIILGFFGTIALIVSAIGMFNTMVVTLLERTQEIGIMKSIGASDYDILWMFVFESTIMGFLGGIIGLALGYAGGVIFNTIFNLLARSMGGYAVSLFYFPIWFLVFILAVATLLGFFTGLIPARKASNTDPLEALRYK